MKVKLSSIRGIHIYYAVHFQDFEVWKDSISKWKSIDASNDLELVDKLSFSVIWHSYLTSYRGSPDEDP
jgi:hypothetical protein